MRDYDEALRLLDWIDENAGYSSDLVYELCEAILGHSDPEAPAPYSKEYLESIVLGLLRYDTVRALDVPMLRRCVQLLKDLRDE